MSWTDDEEGDAMIARMEMPLIKPRKTKKLLPEAMVLDDETTCSMPPKVMRQNAIPDGAAPVSKKRGGSRKKWFVDFQYYQSGLEIFPKEIAFMSLDGASRRYLFARVGKCADEGSASTFNRQFCIHGISWNVYRLCNRIFFFF